MIDGKLNKIINWGLVKRIEGRRGRGRGDETVEEEENKQTLIGSLVDPSPIREERGGGGVLSFFYSRFHIIKS